MATSKSTTHIELKLEVVSVVHLFQQSEKPSECESRLFWKSAIRHRQVLVHRTRHKAIANRLVTGMKNYYDREVNHLFLNLQDELQSLSCFCS